MVTNWFVKDGQPCNPDGSPKSEADAEKMKIHRQAQQAAMHEYLDASWGFSMVEMPAYRQEQADRNAEAKRMTDNIRIKTMPKDRTEEMLETTLKVCRQMIDAFSTAIEIHRENRRLKDERSEESRKLVEAITRAQKAERELVAAQSIVNTYDARILEALTPFADYGTVGHFHPETPISPCRDSKQLTMGHCYAAGNALRAFQRDREEPL